MGVQFYTAAHRLGVGEPMSDKAIGLEENPDTPNHTWLFRGDQIYIIYSIMK